VRVRCDVKAGGETWRSGTVEKKKKKSVQDSKTLIKD